MQIYKYHAVTSTQDLAKKYLSQEQEKAAFIAETQTAGYGKGGRIFYSPIHKGIYLSLALPGFKLNYERAGLLTLAIGVEVVQVLQRLLPTAKLQLKWVNDIYLNDKKIAGILTEKTKDGLVIGLGVNIVSYSFPDEIAGHVGSMNLNSFNSDKISKDLIQAVSHATDIYLNSAILTRYRRLSYLTNKEITLKLGHREVTGKVLGIDNQGRLVINSSKKVKAYASGEVTKVDFHN